MIQYSYYKLILLIYYSIYYSGKWEILYIIFLLGFQAIMLALVDSSGENNTPTKKYQTPKTNYISKPSLKPISKPISTPFFKRAIAAVVIAPSNCA